jgi:hypothetical protein
MERSNELFLFVTSANCRALGQAAIFFGGAEGMAGKRPEWIAGEGYVESGVGDGDGERITKLLRGLDPCTDAAGEREGVRGKAEKRFHFVIARLSDFGVLSELREVDRDRGLLGLVSVESRLWPLSD